MPIRPIASASLALMTAATLALSACQKEADKPEIDNVAISNVVEEAVTDDDANGVEPVNASNASAAPAAANNLSGIPVAFRGRWGMNEADCDVSRADTKGLVTIDANSLKFYESMGRLKSIISASATEVKGNFAFSGEGQSWTKVMTLKLDKGGTTLVRIEQDPTGTYRHIKCA
ncbi:MAG: hypothetical protein ACSLE1_16540 [Sphingobium sp.]